MLFDSFELIGGARLLLFYLSVPRLHCCLLSNQYFLELVDTVDRILEVGYLTLLVLNGYLRTHDLLLVPLYHVVHLLLVEQLHVHVMPHFLVFVFQFNEPLSV